jgi:hypothetical protein
MGKPSSLAKMQFSQTFDAKPIHVYLLLPFRFPCAPNLLGQNVTKENDASVSWARRGQLRCVNVFYNLLFPSHGVVLIFVVWYFLVLVSYPSSLLGNAKAIIIHRLSFSNQEIEAFSGNRFDMWDQALVQSTRHCPPQSMDAGKMPLPIYVLLDHRPTSSPEDQAPFRRDLSTILRSCRDSIWERMA